MVIIRLMPSTLKIKGVSKYETIQWDLNNLNSILSLGKSSYFKQFGQFWIKRNPNMCKIQHCLLPMIHCICRWPKAIKQNNIYETASYFMYFFPHRNNKFPFNMSVSSFLIANTTFIVSAWWYQRYMTAPIIKLFMKSEIEVNTMCKKMPMVDFFLKLVQNVHAKYMNE